jgi:NAD(P)-dependent dehydrogenase (short-subunit alcohol dehydrogenase family)
MHLSIVGAIRGPRYDPNLAYGHSKFANMVFSKELNKRATASALARGCPDAAVVCNAVHPGFVKTELTRHREVCCFFFFLLFASLILFISDGSSLFLLFF